jgi:hypothetical protein
MVPWIETRYGKRAKAVARFLWGGQLSLIAMTGHSRIAAIASAKAERLEKVAALARAMGDTIKAAAEAARHMSGALEQLDRRNRK